MRSWCVCGGGLWKLLGLSKSIQSQWVRDSWPVHTQWEVSLISGSSAETVRNVADQKGSCWTGVLALVYLFLEMAVSNLVGGRVRPGALLDSVHVQLRKHGRARFLPFHSQSLEMSASALPVPGTAGGDVVDFSTLPSFSCPVSIVTLEAGPHCPILEQEAHGR